MNKRNAPSIEQTIVTMLANNNAGSEALADCIRQVEAAAVAADATAKEERAAGLDLVKRPNPKEAHDAVVAAEMTRDRLKANLPKLRDKLAIALAVEQRDRWWESYRKVRQQRDEAAKLFERYPALADEIAALLVAAEQADKEVSRINGGAPDGEHRRLQSVELHARNLTRFTRDQPSLAATAVIPRWDNSSRTLWPQRSFGALAAEFAQGMVVPAHPGPRWSDPEVQQQRRAEAEQAQQRQADYYRRETELQEERINREERERVGLRS
jgi:hypothetical protein